MLHKQNKVTRHNYHGHWQPQLIHQLDSWLLQPSHNKEDIPQGLQQAKWSCQHIEFTWIRKKNALALYPTVPKFNISFEHKSHTMHTEQGTYMALQYQANFMLQQENPRRTGHWIQTVKIKLMKHWTKASHSSFQNTNQNTLAFNNYQFRRLLLI